MIEDHIKFDSAQKVKEKHEIEGDYDEMDSEESIAAEISEIAAEEFETISEYLEILDDLHICLVPEKCEPDIVFAIKEIKEKILPEKMNHISILSNIIVKISDMKLMKY